MLSVEGMEELRHLGGRVVRQEATAEDQERVRGLLAAVHPAVRGFAWPQVEDLLFYALGIYAFGYLGQKAAQQETAGANAA